MSFVLARPLPIWLLVAAVLVLAGLAIFFYRRPIERLSPLRRNFLVALRAALFLLLLLFLLQPTLIVRRNTGHHASLAVLVDTSQSMRIADRDHLARVDRARAILDRGGLLKALGQRFHVQLYQFGDRMTPAALERLKAEAPATDLAGAIAAVSQGSDAADLAGIVVLTDGADTGTGDAATAGAGHRMIPVFPIGIGADALAPDREITAVDVSDSSMVDSFVDLTVTVANRGFGAAAFEVRVLENGQLGEVRRVRPSGGDVSTRELFTLAPRRGSPTVYTVEIPPDPAELVTENNRRSILVEAQARPRRLLLVEGSPSHEYRFIKRALDEDPGLASDALIRKGRNDKGVETYYIQSHSGTPATLSEGYPRTREELFAYDAVVFADVEVGFFSQDQLELTRAFVAERGGGFLMMGGPRAFARGGYLESPIEEMLPIELSDRGGLVVRTTDRGEAGDRPAAAAGGPAPAALASQSHLALTLEGQQHPMTRLALTREETRRRWQALPALAATEPVGTPKPGALVLATAAGRPVIAVERYGLGRTASFAADGSYRWRMLLPAEDHTHERFWRQTMRWLAASAPDPISATVEVPRDAPVEPVSIRAVVRDRAFRDVADASVRSRITAPDGSTQDLTLERLAAEPGTYGADYRPQQPGLYRVQVMATGIGRARPPAATGATSAAFLVGGMNAEFGEPHLNEPLLRRLAAGSGGRYLPETEAGRLAALIPEPASAAFVPARRDLWNTPPVFLLLLGLLAGEWILRRRCGLI